MFISPFTPLRFTHCKTDGLTSRYVQTFKPSDSILVQIIGTQAEADPVMDICCQSQAHRVQFNTWAMSGGVKVWFTVLRGLTPSDDYWLYIPNYNIRSEKFRVTDNKAELDLTTLIQYSMVDNRERTDGVFLIDGVRYFFDFRVPGGFKDSGWTFGVDNEQFTTDESDIVELYARESTQKTFTMGNQQGCPIWFGEMLNRALCCSYVYFDGERYARNGGSVPEKTQIMDGINSFVFNQQVQRVVNLDPMIESENMVALRRDEGADALDWRVTSYQSNNVNRIIQ